MLPVRKLVLAVCEAVKELRDVKGTSLKNITAYIRHMSDGNVAYTSVRKAVNTAVENKLLKQTRDGRFKLNALAAALPENSGPVDKLDSLPQPVDCG